MLVHSESAIRASFVNTTQGEAKRLAVPNDLDGRPWDDLDFLGWRDPAAPQRAYLVAEADEGLIGVALRVAPQQTGRGRRSMCSLCLTNHSGDGVSLMTARKAGPDGRQGNSVGVYVCSDLACSLYLRGKKHAGPRMHETLTVPEKVERTRTALTAFLRKVTE
ncbi:MULTISPECIES: FBP domain-containing protein [unclassified Micromonospora]|uniref:FBP domain-containing protein n=1 Tax=unclassified Micromonospora TaxID=2617518 RepID=UPI00249B9A46|nr:MULTISPECIES: FBP domain-containing protein [unclassified Micromonospora]WFE49132.1 FBP domain-containing protein [Micromonospora sp. WMMD1155]WFF04082.1 FBP domain-containing protein [Micromonospora sp. WMMD964]